MVGLDCQAMVLVGAPNIGKTLIVRAIRSGMPEVNTYPFTKHSVTLGHVPIFWELEQEVASGNVANISTPSKRQLIQECLVKGCKDKKKKKKKKNNNGDVREEKRQLDGKGGKELGGVNAIRIDDNNNDARWGDVGEGMPHH
jgi:hypothetical protein